VTEIAQPTWLPPGRRVTPTAYRVLAADADERTWLDARRLGIGSSDIAAVLGVAAMRTSLHVWHDKRGSLPDDDAGEAALWGKLHEDTVAREWARRNRSTVRRVGLVARIDVHDTDSWMMCTLDRQIGVCPLDRDAGAVCALEVKTRNAFVAGKWRREVPDDVLAQVVWQMAVTGYGHIHVACLIGGNDYRQYVIRRDTALETDVVAAGSLFWHTNVLGGIRPDVDLEAYGDDLVDLDNRLYPIRGTAADVDGERALQLIRDYETARLLAARYEARQKAAKAALVMALDGNEAAIRDGDHHRNPMWTYLPRRQRPAIDLAGLAERHPDAYADCVTEKTGRVLGIARDLRLTEEDLDLDTA
jgi:putative phage-type endonuclease